jgi:DNA repair protein RecO (recombination protein O)
VARSYKTDAVVLRSFRFGEADRVLHLYTADRGRVGAVAKGVRKTKSRFGARLEPLSHVELMLHQGSGELHTVTGAALVDPHRLTREDPYRLSVGLVGAEAMLRLFVEQERSERAFEAVTRFLTVLDTLPGGLRGRAALDPLALAFQLKLLWLSGYFPHLESCVECGEVVDGLVGFLPRAGGAVCAACAPTETVELTPEGFRGVLSLVSSPLAESHGLVLGERASRDALAVVVSSYEFHGGFRLKTLSA